MNSETAKKWAKAIKFFVIPAVLLAGLYIGFSTVLGLAGGGPRTEVRVEKVADLDKALAEMAPLSTTPVTLAEAQEWVASLNASEACMALSVSPSDPRVIFDCTLAPKQP